ncbi:hypothetical protein EUGRSUZ_E02423 [Eucalyptus grandis]|uniref:Uncharacterized protein n=2 Tax=Eucalyptus grandis TaxID=71139 RepID=A0ACC3KX39_EUCGR|nr:hypothetical protein EUGRSUZ_E02423 [Eucalyptus grandis]
MRSWLSIVHKSSYIFFRSLTIYEENNSSLSEVIHHSLWFIYYCSNKSNEFRLYSDNCSFQICQSISSTFGHAQKENAIKFFNVKKTAFNHFLISPFPCMVYDALELAFHIVT